MAAYVAANQFAELLRSRGVGRLAACRRRLAPTQAPFQSRSGGYFRAHDERLWEEAPHPLPSARPFGAARGIVRGTYDFV